MGEVPRVATVHLDEGYRTGLVVGEGPKYMSIIWPDSAGIGVTKLAWVEHRINPSRDVTLKTHDMPAISVPKAKKILRRMGKHCGITKAAKNALRA
jgi:hypothetical protein